MKAIILAAGRGSRLKKFTDDRPKCLNVVTGKTILERQIDVLKKCGVDTITIVGGYRSEMLKDFDAKMVINPDWENTNMVRSLLCAREMFNEPAIVSYSDILYGPGIVSELMRCQKDAALTYDLDWKKLWSVRFADPLDDAETFKIDNDGRLTEIGSKPSSVDEIQGQYMGLLSFTPVGFAWMTDFTGRQNIDVLARMDMTSMLRGMIGAGYPIYGVPVKGGWCEVDTISDLELADSMLREGRLRFD